MSNMSKEETYRLAVPYFTDPMQPFTQANEIIELVKAHSGKVESSREGTVEDQRIISAAFPERSAARSCQESLRAAGYAAAYAPAYAVGLDEPVDFADETGQFDGDCDNDCGDSGRADACHPVLDPLQRAEARYADRYADLDADLDADRGDDLDADLNDDLNDACRIATQEFADFIFENTPVIEWFDQTHQNACRIAKHHPALDAWHLAEIRFVERLTHAVHENGFANKPVDVWRAMHRILENGFGNPDDGD